MNFYQIKSQRALTTLRDGAPNFPYSFGAIAAVANEFVVVNETIPRARKYQPLTSIVLTNNSGENLDLALNGHDYGRLPAGVIWEQTDRPIWSIRITNNDTTATSAGEVFMNLTKPPMSQSDFTRLENLYR